MIDSTAESELLQRVQHGDRAAFDALVKATAPAVWAVVRKLTADTATAEDALQETYVAAWRGASSFRGDGTARAWLYGLARRHAARTWRRRAGEPRTTESLDALATEAGWGADPEVVASRAEDRATLLDALATLSPSDQDILVRCDLEGCAPSDLATELQISAGALRVRLHRARLRLMAALNLEATHD